MRAAWAAAVLILLLSGAAEAIDKPMLRGVAPGTLEASWMAPTTNSDQTPLTNLAGYRLYYGPASASPCQSLAASQTVLAVSPTPGPNQLVTVPLVGLTPDVVYYVAVTAYNTAGNESGCSPLASAPARQTGPSMPGTPTFGTPVFGQNAATYPMTWAPSLDPSGAPIARYSYKAYFNDNTAGVEGLTETPSVGLVMPYHASGAQQDAWACVAEAVTGAVNPEGSCSAWTVLAKPVVPPETFTLAATTAGTGQGAIAMAPPGATYPKGTTVTVTGTAATGSTFMGWTGACTGAGPCAVVMDANKQVVGTFTLTIPTAPAPPNVATAVKTCDVVLAATPPDTTTGWQARFKMDAAVVFGTTDTTPPFTRSKTGILPGVHTYYVEWLKAGVFVVKSQVATVPCPNVVPPPAGAKQPAKK